MLLIRIALVFLLSLSSIAFAQDGDSGGGSGSNQFGLNIALGLPYLTHFGVNYRLNSKIGFSAGYSSTSIDMDEASVDLSMPEVLVHYHPFSGAFYIAGGFGKESFEATATESGTSNQIKAELDATTTILKTGWMWGAANGGFWFGVDLAYIIPSGADAKITAPGVPTSDPNYQDVVDAANDLGETSYPQLTLVRLGWLF